MAAGDRVNRQAQRRPSGRGAFQAELVRIDVFIHNTRRHWFTSSDVGLSGATLKAMARRNLLKTAGRVGTKQAYEIRTGGWVIE